MSDIESNSGQALAPTWLIVSHLLGAAVMLYFVSDSSKTPFSETVNVNPVINVAELQQDQVINTAPLDVLKVAATDRGNILPEQ